MLRGHSHIFLKGFDKITAVIKAALIGNFRDGKLGGAQNVAGALHTVIVQIIHGSPVHRGTEITAEVFGLHARNP